jgi:hypothetical protein
MDLHTSVTEFFHDAVTTALRSQSVTAAEPTEFYLVHLLSGFTKATRLDEEPLVLQMAQLSGATPDARMKGLKHIGDTSLYVSGFFADSLTRRLVDVDYYIAMGGAAYSQLAGLMEGSRSSAGDFFRAAYCELSAKFAIFVEVLTEVRRKTNFVGGTNLLRLCEEWVRTGNEWLAKRLRDTGVVALPAPSAIAGQRQRN